tara:strand:+ start:166 stop:429 length:264 start_codon:yes stop_codon:yes gene_type:complete
VPPDPVHEIENSLSPRVSIVICSEPDVPFEPCQDPEAEHELAFVDDHDRVTVDDKGTEVDEALNDTDGAGSLGVGAGDPPPPPPPHE